MSQVSQESICDEAKLSKAVNPHTSNCTKRTSSQAFSGEYTYLNIFAHCFILIETSLFKQIKFQNTLIFVK